MKLFSHISHALQALIEVTTKAFTKTIPEVGETTFIAAHMINNTISTSALAQAIENRKEINLLLGLEEQVTEEQLAEINKRLEY